MCKGDQGSEELGRLQGALELEGRRKAEAILPLRHPSQSTGAQSASACAHLCTRVPGAFLLDLPGTQRFPDI